jgi:hypothetical protein
MDEVTLALAGAVVGATAEVGLGRAAEAWRPLVAFVRRRFLNDPDLSLPKEGAVATPDDVRRTASAIADLRRSDDAFAATFDQLWAPVRAQLAESDTANVIGGDVDGVAVQAGKIAGGVTIDGRRRDD